MLYLLCLFMGLITGATVLLLVLWSHIQNARSRESIANELKEKADADIKKSG